MTKINALCEECKKIYEYELKPGFPRKYCPDCSAQKKADYEAQMGEPQASVPVEKPGEIPGKRFPSDMPSMGKTSNGQSAMYVSYAKDIFCALVQDKATKMDDNEVMKLSIELVKQAQAAF